MTKRQSTSIYKNLFRIQTWILGNLLANKICLQNYQLMCNFSSCSKEIANLTKKHRQILVVVKNLTNLIIKNNFNASHPKQHQV